MKMISILISLNRLSKIPLFSALSGNVASVRLFPLSFSPYEGRVSVSLLSHLTASALEVRQTKEGGRGMTAAGLFAPCSVEPFINYGERAGVSCAQRIAARKERVRDT